MYIKVYSHDGLPELIGTYTKITGLSYAPSADLAGASIPINEFQVDIHTTDTIEIGGYAELYDDLDNLWAQYWIVYAEHIDQQTLRLRAQSDIGILDKVELLAVYVENASVTSVLDDTILWSTIGSVVPMSYSLDSSLASATITGFFPHQTARERLMWIAFTIGGYVKTHFNQTIEILPIDNTVTAIPMGDTYWKPSITYNSWVTAIRGHAYTFAIGTPSATDTYVEDWIGNTYIVTETTITIQNQNAPEAAPENVVDINGLYLLNGNNISGVLTRLTAWYFNRTEVDFDAINNGQYIPGDKVQVHLDDEKIASGFITSATFAFGLQAKATMHLTGVEDVEAGKLKILYKYNGVQIGKKVYSLPVGYTYTITNPYIDKTMNEHHYVVRPLAESITGTMTAGTTTVTQNYAVALDLYKSVLHIISVDSITTIQDETTLEITGVIE